MSAAPAILGPRLGVACARILESVRAGQVPSRELIDAIAQEFELLRPELESMKRLSN